MLGIDLLIFDIDFSTYEHWPRLSQGWFDIEKVITVHALRLHRLNIDGISADAFNCPELSQVQMLELKGLQINILKEGVFNGLHKLRFLTLSQMIIDRIEPRVLAPVPNLQTLTLICASQASLSLDNLFGTINMFYLGSVTVEHCNLKRSINSATFSGLRNITELRLTSNQIEEIEPKSFDVVLNTLKFLNLRTNALRTVPKNLFKDNTIRATVYINDNPWHCSCKLEHLRLFIESKKNMMFDTVVCSTPRRHSRFSLTSISTLCSKSEGKQHNTFLVKCEPTNFVNVTLTKSREPNRAIYSKNGQLFVVNDNPKHFQLIRFKQNGNSGGDIKCMTHLKNKKSKWTMSSAIKSNLLAGEIYRFCSMQKNARTVTPLECKTLYWSNVTGHDNAWIMQKNKASLLIGFFFAIAHAFLVGLVVTIASVKLLPKYVQKWRKKGAKEQVANCQATNGQTTNRQATNGQATRGQATNRQAANGRAISGQVARGQAVSGPAVDVEAAN